MTQTELNDVRKELLALLNKEIKDGLAVLEKIKTRLEELQREREIVVKTLAAVEPYVIG